MHFITVNMTNSRYIWSVRLPAAVRCNVDVQVLDSRSPAVNIINILTLLFNVLLGVPSDGK